MNPRMFPRKIRNFAGTFIEVSSTQKRKYLNFIRELVEDYTPEISKISGVKLSIPEVKDYRELLDDEIYFARDSFLSFNELKSRRNNSGNFSKILTKILLDNLLGWTKLINFLPHNLIDVPAMCYGIGGRNVSFPAVYVPLNIHNINNLFVRGNVYRSIIHELSHHLWFSTPNHKVPRNNDKIGWLWSEGFASYLESNEFSKLIPKGKPNNPAREYQQAFQRGIYIAVEHGMGSFWKIPSEYKHFENEYKNHLESNSLEEICFAYE